MEKKKHDKNRTSIKRFAFFLPQFHEIEENNRWWGKGFTEWVNVRNASPLFDGHKQPKVPLDGYYNLLDKKTMVHQTEQMKKYSIDGMIYYHYYFCGNKLLEKPAENLLKWKDINQHFFFCWANHSWKKNKNGKAIILQEQSYGDEKDWEKHFGYLLPFFKDERYEKRNNKPVLMIYKPAFEEKNRIMDYFDKKCKENGFDGLFVINSCFTLNEYKKNKKSDIGSGCENYYFLREPSCSQQLNSTIIKKIKRRVGLFINSKTQFSLPPLVYDGDKMLENTTKKTIHATDVYHGICFEWDNTPRHGNLGYILSPVTKRVFMDYYESIKNEEYVFINAWNEWAEGMMLEGTEENGYKYLEWLKEASDEEKK